MVKNTDKKNDGRRLSEVRRRIDEFKAAQDAQNPADKGFTRQESKALQIGVELLSGVIVGVGLGLILDHWLDTKPLFLIIMFFLGSVTGVYNVFKITKKM